MICRDGRAISLAAVAAISLLVNCTQVFGSRYQEVEESLRGGDVEQARSALTEAMTEDYMDSDGFYYTARLEPKGDLAIDYLTRSLNLCEDAECGRNLTELADGLYASGRYREVIELFDQYESKVDKDPSTFGLFWRTALSYLRLEDYKKAEDIFDKISDKFDFSGLSLWGELGEGIVKVKRNDFDDARRRFDAVTRSGGDCSALALYCGALLAADNNKRERALEGYNLLDIRFPNFIGSKELADQILSTGESAAGGRLESLADVTYAVEMGMFREKQEADKLVARLKAGKWTVSLDRRLVADRNYWIVKVGIFRSQQSAFNAKEKLESLIPGNYRVVIR
jgi:tetratricopeptide (TPR) repeat protein